MIAGVVKESYPGERRVALNPPVLPALKRAGVEALIEAGAGEAAGFTDQAYRDAGARIVERREEVFAEADVVLQVRSLGANPEAGRADLALLRKGQLVIGFAEPLALPEAAQDVARTGATSFALELMPRITRAQSMDALSSMATIAGYKAVLLAASALPKMFPLMMTAAGTISAARVFILGAGVAGLQAIASARRLGAIVEAYDVRPAVKEQVQSLGAKFVELPIEAAASEDKGGYAKELGPEFYRKQSELMTKIIAASDVVITTAMVPGRKAPVLVTAAMAREMKPGSVIIDLAAEKGGNCELTRRGESVVDGGVTIIGPENITSTVPNHASQMIAKNIATFLQLMVKDGKPAFDLKDEIIRETMMTHEGDVVHARLRELLGLGPLAASTAAAASAGASRETQS